MTYHTYLEIPIDIEYSFDEDGSAEIESIEIGQGDSSDCFIPNTAKNIPAVSLENYLTNKVINRLQSDIEDDYDPTPNE